MFFHNLATHAKIPVKYSRDTLEVKSGNSEKKGNLTEKIGLVPPPWSTVRIS